ncbi:MAG: ABC transporter permease [Longimonas sp.]|uniref:ABC transporter permease n=1 Tax=Longimonas sp. TaxID=2039626 RepID=UPI0033506E6A
MRRFIFDLIEGLRIALNAIWANRLRSILTTLGIIIGIVSVTLMAALISGVNEEFEETLSSLGADVMYVSKFPWGANVNVDWWEMANRPAISADLVNTIQEQSAYASFVAPMANTGRTVSHRDRSARASITGSTPLYGQIRGVDLAEGRFLTDADERGARNVCVIGAGIADELFPQGAALGQQVRMGMAPCTVVGVMEREGSGLFGDEGSHDNTVIIPFQSFERVFGVSRWRSITIMVKVGDTDLMPVAEDELTGILRTARQVDPMEANNFEINQQDEIRASFSTVRLAIYGVGIFLTALALVVGGIGVMNIMFVSVKERTKEIGIRKAVGAKRYTILLQFLIEAIIVCLIGGAIGVGITYGLTTFISEGLGFAAQLPVQIIALAFGICVSVGILFGIAPAWQAAQARPIEALRYE